MVTRVCRCVPRLGVLEPHALRDALFDGSQDVFSGSARVMPRLRVVRWYAMLLFVAYTSEYKHRIQKIICIQKVTFAKKSNIRDGTEVTAWVTGLGRH